MWCVCVWGGEMVEAGRVSVWCVGGGEIVEAGGFRCGVCVGGGRGGGEIVRCRRVSVWGVLTRFYMIFMRTHMRTHCQSI